jgi:hypothetical protein
MRQTADTAPNPVLQYLAIMSAARDFGLSQSELVRVAKRFHPLDISPRALADVLVDALTGQKPV